MPIIDFVVLGPPYSESKRGKRKGNEKKRRDAWIASVQGAAELELGANHRPVTTDTSVYIAYYFRTIKKDVDNILKPILDALGSQQSRPLVWVDDVVVFWLTVERFDLSDRSRLDSPPAKVYESLKSDASAEPLYIRIEWED
jgi:Holliday junction resolvase RusA-like endonuclease